MEERNPSESQVRRVASIQKLLGRVPTWLLEPVKEERPRYEAPAKPTSVKVTKTKFRTYYFLVG